MDKAVVLLFLDLYLWLFILRHGINSERHSATNGANIVQARQDVEEMGSAPLSATTCSVCFLCLCVYGCYCMRHVYELFCQVIFRLKNKCSHFVSKPFTAVHLQMMEPATHRLPKPFVNFFERIKLTYDFSHTEVSNIYLVYEAQGTRTSTNNCLEMNVA